MSDAEKLRAVLITALRGVKQAAADGVYAKHPSPSLSEVAATVEVLRRALLLDRTIAEEGLADPLFRLGHAFVDISQGKRPDMLTVPAAARGGKKSVAEANLMGLAARALDEMLAARGGRDPNSESAMAVARAIQAARLPGAGSVSAATVTGWRERLREGAGRAPELALMRYQADLPPEIAAQPPSARGAFLLDYIRRDPTLRWV